MNGIQEEALQKHCGKGNKNTEYVVLLLPLFSSTEHEVLRVRHCDHSPSVGVCRLSVRCPFTFSFLHSSIYKYQSAPNLVKIYMTIRSRMSSILGLTKPEPLELFALEFKKNAIFHCVDTLASTNINQSASNLVKIYMTIKSRKSLILDLIGLE